MSIINVRKAVMGWAKSHTHHDHTTVHGIPLDHHVQHVYDLADRYAPGMPDVAAAAALMRFPTDAPAKRGTPTERSRAIGNALGERTAMLTITGDAARLHGYIEPVEPQVAVVLALDLFIWLDIEGGMYHVARTRPADIAIFWADRRWLAHQMSQIGHWIGRNSAHLHPELASMLVGYHATLASAYEKAAGRS